MKDRKIGLTGNLLKVIAIIAMTIDHLAWMGIETYGYPWYLRCVIFLFKRASFF